MLYVLGTWYAGGTSMHDVNDDNYGFVLIFLINKKFICTILY